MTANLLNGLTELRRANARVERSLARVQRLKHALAEAETALRDAQAQAVRLTRDLERSGPSGPSNRARPHAAGAAG